MKTTKRWPISFTREQIRLGLAVLKDPEMRFLFARALQNLDARNLQEENAAIKATEKEIKMAAKVKKAFEKSLSSWDWNDNELRRAEEE
jgi:hypothetical protein